MKQAPGQRISEDIIFVKQAMQDLKNHIRYSFSSCIRFTVFALSKRLQYLLCRGDLLIHHYCGLII